MRGRSNYIGSNNTRYIEVLYKDQEPDADKILKQDPIDNVDGVEKSIVYIRKKAWVLLKYT